MTKEQLIHHCDILKEIRSKSAEDVEIYFSSGRFNHIAEGYMIKALRDSQIPHNRIIEILQNFQNALDAITPAEAATIAKCKDM